MFDIKKCIIITQIIKNLVIEVQPLCDQYNCTLITLHLDVLLNISQNIRITYFWSSIILFLNLWVDIKDKCDQYHILSHYSMTMYL